MRIWKTDINLGKISERCRNTMIDYIGIELVEIGDDYLKGRMPVDHRTKQRAGILHGGASAALAETLGSIASSLCVDTEKKMIVGLEINANHIRPVKDGYVTGITRPIHIGNSTQIWDIRIYDSGERLVCVSRLTVANIDKDKIHGAASAVQ
jgi:1,4-dihydroxy-2-naphthoyl-CoA hydrolase